MCEQPNNLCAASVNRSRKCWRQEQNNITSLNERRICECRSRPSRMSVKVSVQQCKLVHQEVLIWDCLLVAILYCEICATSIIPAVNHQRSLTIFFLSSLLVHKTYEVHQLLRVFWNSFVRPMCVVKLLQSSAFDALQLNTITRTITTSTAADAAWRPRVH